MLAAVIAIRSRTTSRSPWEPAVETAAARGSGVRIGRAEVGRAAVSEPA
jgi:hypothetical protein